MLETYTAHRAFGSSPRTHVFSHRGVLPVYPTVSHWGLQQRVALPMLRCSWGQGFSKWGLSQQEAAAVQFGLYGSLQLLLCHTRKTLLTPALDKVQAVKPKQHAVVYVLNADRKGTEANVLTCKYFPIFSSNLLKIASFGNN